MKRATPFVLLTLVFFACAGGQPKVSTLVKQLRSSDSAVKIKAANILAGLGTQAEPALPGLLTMFRDTRKPLHDAAAKAIAGAGP
ncbi:MAG TPA: hypothetical protein PKZ00_04115, partial [Elusimicrobiota bacterium]|nr:hypothetical protein [Elusimicrobiota bacterium]